MVARQLHHKRRRVSRKRLGFFEDNPADNDRGNADKVRQRSDPPCAAKDSAGKKGDNRHLRATGDKRRRHDGHAAVALVFYRPACHNARHAAPAADQHRDKRFPGKAHLAEDAIHDKRDTRHIANILQQRKQEEEHQHLRHKADHRADAANNAVNHQAA
ncbi:hypothetical protein SDC9_147271 [bioreactor metagenome]|uniref:Uncharacterized protein n=1 Tax=bioreactor metagenome TaxID=1076179 RepID=A0A645EE83_9ZZZZ